MNSLLIAKSIGRLRNYEEKKETPKERSERPMINHFPHAESMPPPNESRVYREQPPRKIKGTPFLPLKRKK